MALDQIQKRQRAGLSYPKSVQWSLGVVVKRCLRRALHPWPALLHGRRRGGGKKSHKGYCSWGGKHHEEGSQGVYLIASFLVQKKYFMFATDASWPPSSLCWRTQKIPKLKTHNHWPSGTCTRIQNGTDEGFIEGRVRKEQKFHQKEVLWEGLTK